MVHEKLDSLPAGYIENTHVALSAITAYSGNSIASRFVHTNSELLGCVHRHFRKRQLLHAPELSSYSSASLRSVCPKSPARK
jgi:hypothetical protein